jgi:DNA-binding PadR family transcriptional regulator
VEDDAMYELLILGFMARMPFHGYLITKIINDMIGPFAKFSSGRLYPLLAKLEESGFIEETTPDVHPHNDRRQRTYALTEAGRARFHEVMMDITSNPGDYRTIFWYKVLFLSDIRPDERLFLIDHYLNYCQAHIFHLTHERETLIRDNAQQHWLTDEQFAHNIAVFDDFCAAWQLEVEAARRLRQSEVARISRSEFTTDIPTPEDAHE